MSTRGAYADEPRSYSDVLLEGLAPDRGLYVPTEFPVLSRDELLELNQLSYPQLFVELRSKFTGDWMTYYQQQELAKRAYAPEKFPQVEKENYVPIRQIGHNLFIQNLSLGPSASFKDMAMHALAQDMQFELQRRDETLDILCATTGDTARSAEEAMKGIGRIRLFALSPQNGTMSDFQKGHMAQLTGENIHNISIDAPFSKLQDLVKGIKLDPEFSKLGAVNSINWSRVASQVPYYFSGYFQAIRASRAHNPDAKIGDEVDFVVPSGNMGNALAGYIARKMGLPIRNIIVATNENDVLHRLIQTGVYKSESTVGTSSPSMDINEAASNYERIVYDLLGGDSEQTGQYMKQFETSGTVEFADIGRDDFSLKGAGFDSGASDHAKRKVTIRRLYQHGHGIIDPHTADGVGVALSRGRPEVPTICLETALPVVFEPMVAEALGGVPPREERFENMEQALRRRGGFVVMRCDLDELKKFIRHLV